MLIAVVVLVDDVLVGIVVLVVDDVLVVVVLVVVIVVLYIDIVVILVVVVDVVEIVALVTAVVVLVVDVVVVLVVVRMAFDCKHDFLILTSCITQQPKKKASLFLSKRFSNRNTSFLLINVVYNQLRQALSKRKLLGICWYVSWI